MNHTPQIKKAIQFAARKHHGHLRRETEPLPYVTHLFSVALLVAEGGGDDDTVTAALLHDTIEDTGTTREEIREHFNERVARIVETVTEPEEEGGKKLGWREKKERYFEKIKSGGDEALLVMLADKIDNVESKLEAYEREGEEFLARWKRPMTDYLWYHGEALRIAQEKLPNHPLTKRLAELHEKEKKVFA